MQQAHSGIYAEFLPHNPISWPGVAIAAMVLAPIACEPTFAMMANRLAI